VKMEKLVVGSIWTFEHWYRGVLLRRWSEHNLCTTEGRTHLLDACFSSGTQITAWYVAPFEDDHTPAAGDTYAVPGFTECTDYDEAARVQWQEGGAAAGVITNALIKASLTFNTVKNIYGVALVGGGTAAATKDDQAGGGTLFCQSQFSGGVEAVMSGSTLKVTVEVTCSAG